MTVERLGRVLGVEVPITGGDREPVDGELGTALAGALAGLTTADAVARLEAGGVPCEAVAPRSFLPDLFFEPWALDARRVFAHEHPAHGPIREIGLVSHLSATPARDRGPNALLGAHTRQLLREVGHTDDEIDELVAGGVCVESGDGVRGRHPRDAGGAT